MQMQMQMLICSSLCHLMDMPFVIIASWPRGGIKNTRTVVPIVNTFHTMNPILEHENHTATHGCLVSPRP